MARARLRKPAEGNSTPVHVEEPTVEQVCDPEPFEARFAHGGAFHDGWGCTACDDARDEPHFNIFDMMMRGNQGVL